MEHAGAIRFPGHGTGLAGAVLLALGALALLQWLLGGLAPADTIAGAGVPPLLALALALGGAALLPAATRAPAADPLLAGRRFGAGMLAIATASAAAYPAAPETMAVLAGPAPLTTTLIVAVLGAATWLGFSRSHAGHAAGQCLTVLALSACALSLLHHASATSLAERVGVPEAAAAPASVTLSALLLLTLLSLRGAHGLPSLVLHRPLAADIARSLLPAALLLPLAAGWIATQVAPQGTLVSALVLSLHLLALATLLLVLWLAVVARMPPLTRILDGLRPVMDAAPGPMYVRDRDGREVAANGAWQALARSLHGATALAAVHGPDEPVLRSGEASSFVCSAPGPNGARNFLATRVPLRDATGHAAGVWTTLVEITAQRDADHARRQALGTLHAALDAGGVGVFTLTDATAIALDATARALLGCHASDATAPLHKALARVEDSDQQRLQSALANAPAEGFVVDLRVRDGSSLRRVRLRGRADADARVLGTVHALDAASAGDERMRQLHESLQSALQDTRVGTWVYDCRSEALYWDETMYALCGLEQGAVGARLDDMFARVHPDDRDAVRQDMMHALNTSDGYQSQARFAGHDGHVRLVLARGTITRARDGEPLSIIGVSWDADAQQRAASALEAVSAALGHEAEAVMLADSERRVLSASPRLLRDADWSLEAMPSPLLDELLGIDLQRRLSRHSQWDGPVGLLRGDGSRERRHARVRATLDDDGLIRHYAVTLHPDLAGAPAACPPRYDDRDAFAGALTRRALLQAMATRLASTTVDGATVAVALDLNAFRRVNDAHGQVIGDRILRTLVRRLRHVLGEDFVIGRLGGDEFLVAGPAPADSEAWHALATLVLATIRRPVDLADGQQTVTATAGVAAAPVHARSAEELLQAAQAARGGAAELGHDRYALYSPAQSRAVAQSYRVRSELARAVQRLEFTLLYEPLVDLATREVVGCTARVRWPHPDLASLAGMLMEPRHRDVTAAIAAAEHQVLERVCAQAVDWIEGGAHDLTVALVATPTQLQREGFIDSVRTALRTSGLAPLRLQLEISEATVMQNPFEARRVLGELRALGLKIALHEVGTRQASLGFLRNFPVDCLKIDGGCVRALPGDAGERAIASSVIAVADAQSLEVIAEGVSCSTQLDFLLSAGCRLGQGPLLGTPQSAAKLSALILPQALARAAGGAAGQA